MKFNSVLSFLFLFDKAARIFSTCPNHWSLVACELQHPKQQNNHKLFSSQFSSFFDFYCTHHLFLSLAFIKNRDGNNTPSSQRSFGTTTIIPELPTPCMISDFGKIKAILSLGTRVQPSVANACNS